MASLAQAMLTVSTMIPVEDIQVKKRLDRAYDICLSYGYTVRQVSNDQWSVYKASTTLLEDSSAQYTVDTSAKCCTCPDAETARAGLCKHYLAVMLLTAMKEGA